jgi:hypothetical protein
LRRKRLQKGSEARQDRDDPILACRLYEKRSKKTGNQYFTGRLGNMKVLIFKSRDVAENGDPIWEMKFATSTQAAKKTTPANQFDDSIDIPNEGPAPFRDEEIPY